MVKAKARPKAKPAWPKEHRIPLSDKREMRIEEVKDGLATARLVVGRGKKLVHDFPNLFFRLSKGDRRKVCKWLNDHKRISLLNCTLGRDDDENNSRR